MRTRPFILLLAVTIAPLAAAAAAHPLFNGQNLDGWQMTIPRSFEVKDGLLQTIQGGKGMLWYSGEKTGNATLRVVYKISNNQANSGIFIRIPEKPDSEGYAINHGIEVQIDNNDNDWHCTGTLYSMTKALARPYKPAGEWNTMEITMDGLRTIVKLNGTLVTDYDGVSPVPPKQHPWEPDRGPRPAMGYIGIQNHDEKAVISFKEISVAPLQK